MTEHLTEAFNQANAQYRGLPKIREFVSDQSTMLERVLNAGDACDAAITAFGLYRRLECWLVTLTKLNSPEDYQAALAGSRAVLELLADIALLSGAPEDDARISAWERSAKLKHAHALQANLRNRGSVLVRSDAEQFIRDNEDTIRKERTRFWGVDKKGKPIHPTRWTGCDLLSDLRKIEDRAPGLDLVGIYELHYRVMCFSVHGSTLAGVRGQGSDIGAQYCSVAFWNCARWALAATEFVLRIFGRFNLAAQRQVQMASTKWIYACDGIDLDGTVKQHGPD